MGVVEEIQRIMDLAASAELIISKLPDAEDQKLIRMTLASSFLHDVPEKDRKELFEKYNKIHDFVEEQEALYDNEHLS